MVKRDITETVYEYDKEGKLLKKTVTETHEEEDERAYTTTSYPWTYANGTSNSTKLNQDFYYTTTTTGNCNCSGDSCTEKTN